MNVRGLMVCVALLGSAEALAQCTRDTDCKGDRVCVQGACADPWNGLPAPAQPGEPSAPPPPPPPAERGQYRPPLYQPPYQPPREEAPAYVSYQPPPPALDRGWARPAGFVGLGLGAVMLGLGIGGELGLGPANSFAFRPGPVVILELSMSALLAAAGPVVFVGGRTARTDERVPGSRAFRTLGWIAYGVALSVDLMLAALATSPNFPPGFIAASGALSALSMGFFAGDALLADSQAAELIEASPRADEPAEPAPGSSAPLRFAPRVALFPTPGGGVQGSLGLAGQF